MAKLRKIKRSPTYQAKRDKAAKLIKAVRPHMPVEKKGSKGRLTSEMNRSFIRGRMKDRAGVRQKKNSFYSHVKNR